jgi:transcriptional regulator with PAS, ATPase and Fis domain
MTLRLRWVFPESRVMTLVGRQSVGRDPHCQFPLPGKEISRNHAEFRVDGPLVAVCDVGSRNGVHVNGRKCEAGPLKPGDVIRCGEWIGVVTQEVDDVGFRELATGWFGGSTLAAAIAEAARLPADLPIVLQGETGSGKECAARAIHAGSGRAGPFVAVNCAALPDHLVESELFGHRRGAFTGADKASLGVFRSAHGGTLFLDEIQELPIGIQPKLLRAIERREVVPLGEAHPVPVDVRIVSASQEALPNLVAEGRFRADLQARIDGLTVVLPPLRTRREDIVPLFFEFLRQQALPRAPTLEARFAEALCLYQWPLNVRELLLLTRRLAAIHGAEPTLKREHLPERIVGTPNPASSNTASPSDAPAASKQKRSWRPVDNGSEFEALTRALRDNGGNVSRAAKAIGISRARAYRLLAAHPEFETQRE